ncbi:MAG: hypothetical protein ACRDHN_07185 [Thermomicrobiales bacterium]
MRHREEKNFDEASQSLDIAAAQEIDEVGTFYPIGSPLEPVIQESAAEHSFHVEKDHDAAGGDDDLLSGSSPEFEHLVKRPKAE